MFFRIFGHPNVLCTHRNTLEFTKDTELSKRGDCILGVNADFDPEKLKEISKRFNKVKIIITSGSKKQEISGITNKDFDDNHELVIRRSEHGSKRTFCMRADKVAKDIDRNIVDNMKVSQNVAVVEIVGLE